MGFEQLAELRDRLRAQIEPPDADSAKPLKRKSSPQAKPRIQDPALEAIRLLQKHFPLAFPVNPAPKVPLKEGILKDAEQHLELLGLTLEQLKLGISTWCRGSSVLGKHGRERAAYGSDWSTSRCCNLHSGYVCEAAGFAATRPRPTTSREIERRWAGSS